MAAYRQREPGPIRSLPEARVRPARPAAAGRRSLVIEEGLFMLVLMAQWCWWRTRAMFDCCATVGATVNRIWSRLAVTCEGRRSTMAAPWGRMLDAVDSLLAEGTSLILVAPPHLLGMIRQRLPTDGHSRIVGEIGKDLVGCPPFELARRLYLAVV